MVTLEKIRSSLFSRLYDSFLIDDDPLSDEQDWRNVFDYAWPTDEGYCGHALLDDGEVVGMMGMVFVERRINGVVEKFCNLHTWWVREDHRGRSLMLLRPLLDLQGYTITHFTPCDIVRAVTRKLGFKDLSSQLTLLLPFGLSSAGQSEVGLTYDVAQIASTVAEHDQKILRDHQPYGCGHLLVGGHGDECYLLYTVVVRHWMRYCHIHYISNRRLFERCETQIRRSLIERHRVKFVALDTRLVQGLTFRASVSAWAPGSALYRSSTVRPDQIDNLYSDITFLKLTVLPDTSEEIKKRARRLWPGSWPGSWAGGWTSSDPGPRPRSASHG